jgi:hypothetical protein
LLVNPDEARVARLEGTMPKELRKSSRVVRFPLYAERREAWSTDSASYAVLCQLCAYRPEHHNHLELIGVAFYCAWTDVQRDADGFADIDDIVAHIRRNVDVSLAFPWSAEGLAWDTAQAILAAIPGLSVRIDGGFCHYAYGLHEGRIARCDTPSFKRFVSRVNHSPPKDFDAFWEMIP